MGQIRDYNGAFCWTIVFWNNILPEFEMIDDKLLKLMIKFNN
jgi:hypothetical protein